MPAWCKPFVLVVAGAAALCGLAIYNGYPLFHFDTHGYYSGGQKAFGVLSGAVCDLGLGCASSPDAHAMTSGTTPSAHALAVPVSGTISTGRSPFYGVFLWLADKAASLWLMVAAQAIAASWLLYLGCRHMLSERRTLAYLCAIAILATLSSLPFFVGFLMPDVFAGLYILAMALLIVYFDKMSRIELVMLWILLVFSMLFHRSHVLGAGMLLGLVALFLMVFARAALRRVARPLLLAGTAIAIGTVGFIILNIAVGKLTGFSATTPPFMLARVIKDGPGTSYLQGACAERPYVVCRFADRMPIEIGDFLWSDDPQKGVWYVISADERIKMSEEQYAIVLRSFLHAPLIQTMATLTNFGKQAVYFGVGEFKPNDNLKEDVSAAFRPPIVEAFLESNIHRNRIDVAILSTLHYIVVFGSLLFLAFRFPKLEPHLKTVLLIVLAGILLNALVTGSISTALHRFQSRVIWLLPFVAVVIALKMLLEAAGKRSKGASTGIQSEVAASVPS